MKKIILTIAFGLVSTICLATTYKTINYNTNNLSVQKFESAENVDYWVSMLKFISEAQNSTEDKIVIKYDGKWKYVIPTPEAYIQLDIIISHLTSGTSVKDGSFAIAMKKAFELAKKDGLIVTIR